MMLSERFIVTYAAMVFGTAAVTIVLAVQELEVYYSVYAVEFLLLLELLGAYKKSFSRELTPAAIALFLGFAYIVALKVIQILTLW